MVNLVTRLGKKVWLLLESPVGDPGGRLVAAMFVIVGFTVVAGTWELNVALGLGWPKIVWVIFVWLCIGVVPLAWFAFWGASPERAMSVWYFFVGLLLLATLPAIVAMLALAIAE